MAILSGGALARQGRQAYGGPTKGLHAYLSFYWHGAHDDGEGDHRENDVVLDIAEGVEGGLFNVMFCSVACLRAFLNACLDQFERRVENLRPLMQRPNKRIQATRKKRARA